MAERGADDLDADLVHFRGIDDDLLDGERLAGTSAHRRCLLPSMVRVLEIRLHPWRLGERDEFEAAAAEEQLVPLQRIGLGLWSSMASSRRDPGDGEGGGGSLKRDLTTNGVTTSEFERM